MSTVQALAADPTVDEIVGFARRSPQWSPPRTRFVAGDIRSADLVGLCRDADAVVHLAWAFQPSRRPTTTWDVNVIGGMRMLDAAAEAGVRNIVVASSVAAYAPGPGRQVDERWPTHSMPVAAYGREKAYMERYMDAFMERYMDAFEAWNDHVRLVRIRPCFVFKRESASEQRRIFGGPLVPRPLARPGRLPVLPLPPGLRFQAVHSHDVGEAVRIAVVGSQRGPFNIAADHVIDRSVLGDIFGARTIELPAAPVQALHDTAWRLHAVPAEGGLLQLLLNLPTLDTTRARNEIGWTPRHSGIDALREMLEGLADGAGMATPPLTPDVRRPPANERTGRRWGVDRGLRNEASPVQGP